jgi:N,N'-diacetyllegionaminate synthase
LRVVGPKHPVLVIAEVGYNFNGDYEIAHKMIDEAASAGADVIKFQTYTASGHVSERASQEQWAALRQTELPRERHLELKQHIEEAGCLFMSTPSDESDVDFLQDLGVPGFKLGSDDCTNYQFLRYIAAKGLPMIVSTGTCTLGEVQEAVGAVTGTGNQDLILLQCTTSYPSEVEHANLRTIQTIQRAFQLPVGYSDHTLGNNACIASVALGACIVEKHFTFDKDAPGPDHSLSADFRDFRDLVRGVREVEKALGSFIKEPTPIESSMLESFRKSVVASVDIEAGTTLSADMIEVKRPGTGIPAKEFDFVIGRTAKTSIPVDELITWEMLG